MTARRTTALADWLCLPLEALFCVIALPMMFRYWGNLDD